MKEPLHYPMARVRALQDRVSKTVDTASSLERAAQRLADILFEEAAGAFVLARVFATVAFEGLPKDDADFARLTVRKSKVETLLLPTTPVLSLLGSRGQETSWNRRTLSKSHRAFPLLSREFVHARPMISRLLSDLGLPLDGIVRVGKGVKLQQLMGGASTRLFHVPDARTATDIEGRNIVPQQDFVKTFGVRSVFALGGTWPNGSAGFFLAFAREVLDITVARQLAPIMTVFRSVTTSLVMQRRFFEEESGASSAR